MIQPRYVLRSTGNIIAYLLSTVPLCVLAACALMHLREDRTPGLAHTLFVVLALTIVIAGFSGLFYLETEAAYGSSLPRFCCSPGYEANRRTNTEGREFVMALFILILITSCSQEFLFMHYR